MAITKLMHIKEDKRHLQRSIRYIMNPEKTEGGTLIGGNAGSSPEEVFQTMMDTKMLWGKEEGRQGYHFVISFLPGEVNVQQAYEIVDGFCKEYLGDDYDHVFAIHTDQHHCHGHIIFNSINRNTGYKYRYTKGDWEKFIQPITDRVCMEHGIPTLEYDKEKKKGVSYAEHLAEKEGRPTWSNIICADIDYNIGRSICFEDFLAKMTEMGYRIHQGKHMTFYAPGAERGRRDSTLGDGYTVEDIKERIRTHLLHPEQDIPRTRILSMERQEHYDVFYLRYKKIRLTPYQDRKFTIFYRAGHYLDSRNPYIVNDKEIRKQAMDIDRLYHECRFIMDHDIQKQEDLIQAADDLASQEKQLTRERSTLYKKESTQENEEKKKQYTANIRAIRKERKLVERLISERNEVNYSWKKTHPLIP